MDASEFARYKQIVEKPLMAYMYYSEIEHLQKIVINLTTAKVISDRSGNSNQNISIKGVLKYVKISERVYIDREAVIIFPLKSFDTMLCEHLKDRELVYNLFNTDRKYYLEFKKINKKRYEIIRFSIDCVEQR